MNKEKYDHSKIEKKWQDAWAKAEIFKVKESTDKEKNLYCLDMFPYPSGQGLHVGHPRGYTATDVYSRFMRLKGYNVLHPMGWDAFGLPAENYAIKNKIHPSIAVQQNIKKFKKQISSFGFSYDWSREINTTDPEYYKWTQWIFLKLFNRGLAYEKDAPINWCPSCKTGLANEEVSDGKCERCRTKVETKKIRQWILKITAYADRLLEDLDLLDWPESIKTMQRNWIGESEGAKIKFAIANQSESIEVFTTRPDTLFGATYLVIAPEHPLINKLKSAITNKQAVEEYIDKALQTQEFERTRDNEKTGIKIEGIKAVNPINNQVIPVFIADYVLMSYGTGSIMAVPAHDKRDFEFAIKYDIPIKKVIKPKNTSKSVVIGISVKPGFKDDLTKHNINFSTGLSSNNREHIRISLTDKQIHEYLKLISKYLKNNWWVEVIGSIDIILFKVDNKDVMIKNFFANESAVMERCKQMEKLVSDDKNIWAMLESSLFYQGFACYVESGTMINSGNFDGLGSAEGARKIVAHLAKNCNAKPQVQYKLRDWVFSRQRYWGEPIPIIHCPQCGIVPVPEKDLPVLLPEVKSYEPAGTGESPLANITNWVNTKCPQCGGSAKRETNTMPQWAGSCWYYLAYLMQENSQFTIFNSQLFKNWLPVDLYVGGAEHAVLHLLYARFWHKVLYDEKVVDTKEPFQKLINVGMIVAPDGQKMSKSRGNVINPDDLIRKYGADSLRLAELFIGPFSQSTQWHPNGIVGMRKFLEKIISLPVVITEKSNQMIESELYKMLAKIDHDTKDFQFNTAISAMMIFVNLCVKEKTISQEQYKKLLIALSPYAPHIAQDLWANQGENNFVCQQQFPSYAPQEKAKTIIIPIQVNGKVRGEIEINAADNNESIIHEAKSNSKIKPWLGGKIVKTIYIPWKIINFVVK